MTTIDELRATWESLATEDALWAICTAPDKRGGKWDPAEFFASGEREAETVLTHLHSRNISVNKTGRALDFGCGVGRLTQALGRQFAACVGIDISARMVELAKQFNRLGEKCVYQHNTQPNLALFEDGSFDFIYSTIVLQHIDPQLTQAYLREFIRVLRAGGVLVFQLPDYARSLREKLALRSRVRAALGLNADKQHVYNRMEMNWMAEPQVQKIVGSDSRCSVVDVQITNSCRPEYFDNLRYLSEAPKRGFVSKQYAVVKDKSH